MWINGVSYTSRQTPEGIEQQRQEAVAYAGRLVERIQEIMNQ